MFLAFFIRRNASSYVNLVKILENEDFLKSITNSKYIFRESKDRLMLKKILGLPIQFSNGILNSISLQCITGSENHSIVMRFSLGRHMELVCQREITGSSTES